MDLQPGDVVEIRDNGRIVTHITPRWTYGCSGEVVRLNDRSVTIRLLHYSPGEIIRADYADVKFLLRGAEAALQVFSKSSPSPLQVCPKT